MDRSGHSESFADTSEDFDVREILVLLYKRKWWILLFFLIGAGLGLAYLKLTPPYYEATALVEVPQHQRNVANLFDGQSQDLRSEDVLKTIESNLQNITIFLRIAESGDIRNHPALENSLEMPVESIGPLELAEQLESWTDIGLKSGTRQIAVAVEHTDREFTALLANAIVEEYIQESEEKRIEALRLAGEFLEKEHERITEARQKANRIVTSFDEVVAIHEKIQEQNDALDVLKAQGKGDLHPEMVAVKTLLTKYGSDFEKGLAEVRQNLHRSEGTGGSNSPSPAGGNPEAEFNRLQARVAEISVRVDEYQANLEDILSRKNDNSMALELPAPPVQIAAGAYLPSKPSGPKKIQILTATTILSIGLGMGLLFTRHLLDRSVKTVDEAERAIGLPVLGAIATDPRIPGSGWLDKQSNRRVAQLIDEFGKEAARKKIPAAKPGKRPPGPIEPLIMLSDPGSPISEAFRSLRASLTLLSRNQETPNRSLLVTSSVPGEGKSFVAANLAIAFAAQEEQKTLLIDSDLRCPMIDRFFALEDTDSGGLVEALVSGNVQVIASGIGGLDLLPAGRGAPRPAELLSGPGLGRLIEGIAESYDRIIFDSPPVNSVADALLLAPFIDTTLLVSRASKTPRAAILHARERLTDAGVDPAGLVLNRLPKKSGLTVNPYFYYYDAESGNYGNNYG